MRESSFVYVVMSVAGQSVWRQSGRQTLERCRQFDGPVKGHGTDADYNRASAKVLPERSCALFARYFECYL